MKLRIKIIIGFMSIIVLMGILGTLTYSNFIEINEQFDFLIQHDLEVLQNAQKLQKLIVDAETGQRGFVIVGDDEFLEPYYSGISGFTELVEIEKQLVSTSPAQVERLERIEALFEEWKEKSAIPEIELARIAHETDINSKTLENIIAKGTGKGILDELRKVIDDALEKEVAQGNIEHQLLLYKITKDLIDRETGQRGFIITGVESFLEPYHAGNKNLAKNIAELRLLEEEEGYIDQIETLAERWTIEAGVPEIELVRKMHKSQTNQNYLTELLSNGIGKGILDELRKVIDDALEKEVAQGNIEHQLLLYKITKDLIDRETGQRGFIITGVESFLEPYHAGNKNLAKNIAELRLLEEEEGYIDQIETLAERWTIEAGVPEIELVRKIINENPTIYDVSSLLRDKTGKNILDKIRGEFQIFIQIENDLKDARFDKVHEIKTATEINIGIFVTIAAVIGVFIAMILSHSINKSLKLLISGTERFGRGEFEPIPIAGDDEISDLSDSFNTMATDIEFSNKRLQEMQGAIDLSAVVSITDNDGIITHINDNFCETSKYTGEELIGKTHKVIKSKHQPDEFWKEMWDIISSGQIWKGRIKNKAKDGSEYWQNTTIVPLYDKDENIEQYISISTIITKEIQFEEELKTNIEQLEEQSLELGEKNLELEKTELLKEEFVAMISHELKTPLTPILMWAGALQDSKFMGELNEKQTKATKTILNCATELSELISDIFDSYKLDLEKIEFNELEINLTKLMESIKDTAEKLIGEHKIVITNTTNENITVYSDKKRIDQIFKNLITNAIDFVDQDNGKIEINATVKGEDVEFMIKDNGIGIKKEFQDQLFKKFYQIDTSATRKHGGSGLGLSICQGMVKGMKGKIWVESDSDEGTTFYFTLPIVNKSQK